jgi:DNA-binding MarR family transcriptional regulator
MNLVEVRGFLDTLERLVRVFQRAATAGELSLATAAVLARLVREGPLTMTALAMAESVSQPNMTQLVNRLERDGLARKTAGRADRRTVSVEVTDEGRRVVRQRRQQRAAVLREVLASLDDRDVVVVREALPALTRLVRAMEPIEAEAAVTEATA